MISDDWERNVRQYTQQSNKTPAAVQQAQQIQKAMTDLNSSIENVEVTLLQVFGPDITRGLNSLSDWIKNNKGEKTGFFSDASTQAQKLSDAVGGIGNLLKIYAGYRVGGLPGAAAAIGYNAYKDTESVVTKKDHTESLWDSIKGRISAGGWYKYNQQHNGESNPKMGDVSSEGDWWDSTAKWVMDKIIPSAKASEVTPRIPGVNAPDNVDMTSLLSSIMMTESGGNPSARSGAGAVGAFQFMKGTAQDYGLTVNDQVDERLDPQKSAIAAEAHISRLLRKYGGNVQNALRAASRREEHPELPVVWSLVTSSSSSSMHHPHVGLHHKQLAYQPQFLFPTDAVHAWLRLDSYLGTPTLTALLKSAALRWDLYWLNLH